MSSIPTSPIIAMTMHLTHEASASFLKVGMSRHYPYNFPASVQKLYFYVLYKYTGPINIQERHMKNIKNDCLHVNLDNRDPSVIA